MKDYYQFKELSNPINNSLIIQISNILKENIILQQMDYPEKQNENNLLNVYKIIF